MSYQGTPHSGDVASNIALIQQTVIGAKHLGCDVVVFPELFITGYNIDRHVIALAETIDGPMISQIKRIAMGAGIAIVIGFPESDNEKIYNSAVVINSNGDLVGHHRKVFLFGDKEKSLFTPGDTFTTFNLNGYCCGMSICYDIEFPEPIRILANKGAHIVFNPTANMEPYHEVPKTLARARALENGVCIVYANLSGVEDGLKYTGLSAIIGPDGLDIARAGRSSAVIVADVSEILLMNKHNPTSTQSHDLAQVQFS
ncbi:carbon-nitrogen hydrolase family protein [Vibrio viridaestus]|nr:carbon-nitrogen hydrolase family protein [Vibrio viridaestus]